MKDGQNMIAVPNNATNGEVIETLFSPERVYLLETGGTMAVELEINRLTYFDASWWNAPYRR